MERQLKERLIGAAVLLAVAVIMVPEMFSGPAHTDARPESAAAASIKTYRIDLQTARSSQGSTDSSVEPPAESPRDELPGAASSATAEANVSRSSSSNSSSTASAAQSSAMVVVPTKPVSKPEAIAKVATANTSVSASANASRWVVQIGSFSTQAKAQQLVAKLKAENYAATLGPVQANGKTLYRVRVGTATERAAAESMLERLKSVYPGASVVPINR